MLALAVAGCAARTPAPVAPVSAPAAGWSEQGVASWYGPGFHGKPTASGEPYDMDALTAAHPWLPFGTIVRVHNPENGRTVDVRINDRGPFARGRILDVSRAAARALGLMGPGTARVRLTVLEPGTGRVPRSYPCRVLQVAAFRDPHGAAEVVARVEAEGYRARRELGPDGLTRVLAGPFSTRRAARAAERRFGGFYRACDANG